MSSFLEKQQTSTSFCTPTQVIMTCVDVCPLASELSVINSNIICPEEGCGKIFKASSALNMHLTKHHRNSCLVKRDASKTVRYFCPEEKCVYHVNASRHFTQMKYLKQHYLKVHSEKKFNCESCSKGFATLDLLRYHLQVCGIKFTCSCGNSYSSHEALLTHSKRKQHPFDDKFKSGNKRAKADATVEQKKDAHCFSVDMMQPVYILPKALLESTAVLAPSTADVPGECTTAVHDKSMQTDPVELKRRKTISSTKTSEKNAKRRASAQTQTGGTLKNQYPKKTAETQTIGDYILKKAMADAEIFCFDGESTLPISVAARKRKNNSGTQTSSKKSSKVAAKFSEPILEKGIDAMSLTSSRSFSLKKDVGLPDLWVTGKSTSSSQTAPETSETLLQSDLHLELFSPDGNLCSSRNLQSIFEDNSDSFDNVVDSPSNFEAMSDSVNAMNPLDDLSSRSFTSCNVTQTDQNLNHLFPNESCDDESHASFGMRTTTETQTTDELTDFDSLLYTNMWTQTSDETLFSGLDFADIQTQTAWPLYGEGGTESVLVSAETQTAISSSTIGDYTSIINNDCWSCDASHIETQTCEEELKDLIAELDSD